MRHVLTTIIFASGCVRVSELPDVGACADYPSETYEYGQIGIGTCLAGPNSLRFAGDSTNPTLLVTNANPFKVFNGGSLLAIPWSEVDFGDQANEIDTLDPVALPLPNFASGLEVNQTLGLIGLRESLDARTRFGDDDVFIVDLRDPASPVGSTRGTDAGSTVEVLADPVAIAIDSETGFGFVANRSSESISVLDTTANEIAVVQPWPESLVTAAAYTDRSGVGGTARMVEFSTLGDGQLIDDVWTLRWVEGMWRLWTPVEGGLQRHSTTMAPDADGAPVIEPSGMGTELALADAPDAIEELGDAHYAVPLARMLFSSGGDLWSARTGDYLGDWSFDSAPTLQAEADTWRAHLGGPSVAPGVEATHLFFDAAEGEATEYSVIGTATTSDGLSWTVDEDPILEPQHPHEGTHIADPYVVYDPDTELWRMFYSAFDGDEWTIGHAVSDDLVDWTADESPLNIANSTSAAAPTVHRQLGRWHMWFSAWDGTAWSLAYATSPDGTHWSAGDFGIELAANDDGARPPRATVHGSGSSTFQLRGEATGLVPEPLIPGYTFAALAYGWSAQVLAGAEADLGDLGAESNGGIQVDALFDWADGTATTFWTVANRSGLQRIATTPTGTLDATLFEGTGEGFDRDGASHAVPFEIDGERLMLYAGTRNDRQAIGLARAEGDAWTSEGRVFAPSSDSWDSVSIIPNRIVETADGLQLWYSGFDGARWRIGSAQSTDGRTWTRDAAPRGYQFGLGEPGEWDDSGVRDAWVIRDADGEHLWYSGFDGDAWQIGYAFRAENAGSFERASNPFTNEGRPVVRTADSLFHRSGVTRPVVYEANGGFRMHYAGESGTTVRVGTAHGIDVDRFNRTPRLPRAGDSLEFTTERGDDTDAIPLDGSVDGQVINGNGLAALHVDEERGMLFAGSSTNSAIFVIDIRDDTDRSAGFIDRNYLDVEAVLMLNTSVYATGYRQLLTRPGSDQLMALVDAPESIVQIDIGFLEDNEFGKAHYNIATGFIAAPRGNERDEGSNTMKSVGPGQMVMHPDGQRLFVSNFNRNSVTVYDLRIGPYGSQIREIRNVGENPYALAISPDGHHLVVGNYTGDVEDRVAHATLGIIDINPDSSTYLEAVSWIENR